MLKNKRFFLFSDASYTEKDILSFTEKECLEKCVMHYTMKQMASAINKCVFDCNDYWVTIR